MARVQEYVAPERLKEDMVRLFDAQRAHERRLDPSSSRVHFRPEGVDFTLGQYPFPVWEYTEGARWRYYYRDVLSIVHNYLVDCCDHGVTAREETDEQATNDPRWVLDLEAVAERRNALETQTSSWNTPDEVHESIRSIPVVSFEEQRDRYRVRRAENARRIQAWRERRGLPPRNLT